MTEITEPTTIRAIEIDPVTGDFLADIPQHPEDETGPHIVTTLCPPGFHKPRWDGTQWVEGKSATELQDQIRAQKHAQINTLRQKKILSGFVFEGNTYQSDPQSIANITGKVLSIQTGKALPSGYTWRDANNNDVPHTAESLTNLAWALEDYMENLYKTSWTKKAELDAAADPSTYDIEAGW